jgi:hypothetical protein
MIKIYRKYLEDRYRAAKSKTWEIKFVGKTT